MIGLTENEKKFCHWQICSPEVARLVTEFVNRAELKENEHSEFNHHEDSPSFQEKSKKHASGLAMELEQFGNLFISDESLELFQLDKKDVMGEAVVMMVKTTEEIGKRNYEEFKKARVIDVTQKLEDTITKNKLALFKQPKTKRQFSKSESKDSKLHSRLFSQLYISTQIRGGNMDEIFSHKTLKNPPALSKNGEMQSGNKAELIKCIKTPATATPPKVSGTVLEGSVLVNMEKPSKSQTFKDYSSKVFRLQVKKHKQDYSTERIHVVFGTYKHESLKAAMRCKTEKGVRQKVQHVVPNN